MNRCTLHAIPYADGHLCPLCVQAAARKYGSRGLNDLLDKHAGAANVLRRFPTAQEIVEGLLGVEPPPDANCWPVEFDPKPGQVIAFARQSGKTETLKRVFEHEAGLECRICPTCDGEGVIEYGHISESPEPCYDCDGLGWTYEEPKKEPCKCLSFAACFGGGSKAYCIQFEGEDGAQ
jgi:hypothetical protein